MDDVGGRLLNCIGGISVKNFLLERKWDLKSFVVCFFKELIVV